MHKYLRKITAGAVAVMMLSVGAVFADEYMPDNESLNDTAEDSVQLAIVPITVAYVKTEESGNAVMVPLRMVAENFGYNVEWNDDTQSVVVSKLPHYGTLAIGKTDYTFDKMIVMFETAPVLVNDDTTYVPVEFFSDLIGLFCHIDETYVRFAMPDTVELAELREDGSLLVNDEAHGGEVVVYIGEDTELVANGEAVSPELLKAGQMLNIEYSEAMTMSIPPQTTAVRIEILNLPTEIEAE